MPRDFTLAPSRGLAIRDLTFKAVIGWVSSTLTASPGFTGWLGMRYPGLILHLEARIVSMGLGLGQGRKRSGPPRSPPAPQPGRNAPAWKDCPALDVVHALQIRARWLARKLKSLWNRNPKDGTVWYSESGVQPNTLVRFDPKQKTFLSTAIPSGGGVVRNIAATKDGKLYLACSGVNKVAIAIAEVQ